MQFIDDVKNWISGVFLDKIRLISENVDLKRRNKQLSNDYETILKQYESITKKYYALLSEKG